MTLVPKRLINPKSTLVFLIVLLTLAIRVNSAPASGGSAAISVRFVGTGMPMGAAEVAGVIAKSNWNNEGWFSGTSTSVIDETGTVSGATVSWKADGLHALPIADQPGNVRMMRGYLDGSANATTVTVSGLAANSGGYNVYVYTDGDNGSATRSATYQISGAGITTTSIVQTDSANSNFSGTFKQANNSAGNYVVFTINSSGFTLLAIPGTASDGVQRAPLNGIQIVPVGQAANQDFTLSSAPTSSSVNSGSSTTSTVSVGALNGFSGSVNLSVSGLPTGASASLSPAAVTPGASSTLMVSAGPNTPVGSSMLNITGASTSLTHTIGLALTVNNAGAGPGKTISIKFSGSGTAMASSEVAGVVPKNNWNNEGWFSGTSTSVIDETGTVSGATVSWKADGSHALPIADQPGNVRMMRGYLDGSANATTVTVSGLPSNASGYNVYVYADGDNGAATRKGIYQISGPGITTTSVSLSDAANTNFSGTFTQANNSAGNYVQFTINASAFTISATASTASDGTQRAPLNGIQIVAIAGGTGGSVGPTITTQPASQTVAAGQTGTFSVLASGTAPLSYQWRKNGANISGATSASYVTPATTSADNGATFTVVVSNSTASATSNPATLTVTSDTTPPTVSITAPSSGATVSGTVALTASASDNIAVANVQFQVDGTNLGAADTALPYSFSLDTTTLSNGAHSLTAVATDTSGNHATSAAVPITVSNQVSSGAVPTYANNGSGCPINTVPGGPTDSVTSYNCPLPNPTGAGNLLVVWMRYSNNNQPAVTIRDNVGNSYTQAASCSDTSNGNTVSRLYYAQNVKAGANLITAAFSTSSSYVQMQPYEFFNVATIAALDQAVCQASSGTSITTGLLPDLAASGDLVVHFGFADNGTAIGSCSTGAQSNISWKMRAALIAGPEPMCFQYGVYGATTAFSPTMTFNKSVSYVSLAAAFKAAAAGTPPPTSGIRVAYVQHDNGGSLTARSIGLELPLSGNLAVEVVITSCGSSTLNSCNYATSVSDGTNSWSQIGSTYLSNTGSSQEEPGQIWYAKNATPGLYMLSNTENPSSSGAQAPFPLTWMLYDIVGASSSPLDLGFGGAGNGLATFSSTNSAGPVPTFTVTPSLPNELIITGVGYEWNTFTGVTSLSGVQFISCNYAGETNYSWVDSNGGYAIFYNGNSTAAETWTWPHDTSQQAGSGRGLAIGAAFQAATP